MKSLFLSLILIPVFAFGQVVQGGNAVVPGAVNGPGGGGGTGPYSPTSFTSGAVLIGGGTGPITATGVLGTTGGASLTAKAATDLTLNAGSGNQNVNLNSTGSGSVNLNASGNSSFVFSKAGSGNTTSFVTVNNDYVNGSTGSGIAFGGIAASGNTTFRIQALNSGGNTFGNLALNNIGGNVLVGTTTNNSNGVIQLASASTIAGGIGFGSDIALYRTGTRSLEIGGNGTTTLSILNIGNGGGALQAVGSGMVVNGNNSLFLQVVGSTVVTITGTAATFVGSIATGGAAASATYGNTTIGGTGLSIAPDGNAKFQIGRYSAGSPYGYIKAGSTSSGLKFTSASDGTDIMTMDNSGNVTMGGTVSIPTGSTLFVQTGTNALGGTVTLTAGSGTITSTAITANCIIAFSRTASSGTPGPYQPVALVTAGSAAVSALATDNSTYNWIALKIY